MSDPIRVIQYGLGAIGQAAAQVVLTKPGMQLVAVVDSNPVFAGREICGLPVHESLPDVAADAVIHCTGSSFAGIYEQLAEIVGAGLSCVTSCEEMLFPRFRNPDLAEELNNLCISNSVGVLGTGVNPGFVMDTLPVLLTAVSQSVRSIRVLRVVDAGTRRPALQRKVGAGLTREEFQKLADDGSIRHVGLPDSLAFLAAALGRPYDNIQESIEPVLRGDGRVAGVKQGATGNGLTLELQMYVGAPNPRDEIHIEGNPDLHVVVQGGTPGDVATPAILANMLPRLLEAGPGLHTMATLPLPRMAS
jgi:4-hydroxy-tetrahydrodipicolinate reductase